MQEVFKAGTVKREDVFVITKLWNTNHRPERVKPAFEASLNKLQLDYVDLYLIHTPFAFQPGDEQDPRDASGNVIYDKRITLLDTWEALERLVDEGRCKAIGLSDVDLPKTQEIFDGGEDQAGSRSRRIASVSAAMGPFGVLPKAWHRVASVCGAGAWHRAQLAGRSCRYRLSPSESNKTPAQVLLAWAIQRGTALLTTATTPSRIKENFDVSAIPEEAVREISEGVKTRVRFNAVVETGVPGFIPRAK